ncbi:MAG: MltA domain-containing protein [Desulfobacterales bacterium]|nr:MltA domain-containing protein [Desulfobacterales bacterium]
MTLPNQTRLMVLCIVSTILWQTGCTPRKTTLPAQPDAELYAVRIEDWPAFADDMDFDGLEDAINQSLVYLSRLPDDRRFRFGAADYSKNLMVRSLALLRDFAATRPDQVRLQQFLRQHYQLYRSIGRPPDGDVLFTGYFEPLYAGSLHPSPVYNIPVYGIPEDLVSVNLSLFSPEWAGQRIVGRLEGHQLLPYHTRAKIIHENVLQTKAPIIAWLRDPVDLYFLQVQGSGSIKTPAGQKVRILYAAQNGHPSELVGRHLIRENKVPPEEMSMQRIRRYFREHPEDTERMLNQDPSFVFFRIGETGPLGNLGVEVTPGRSIATDRHLFPPGALAYITSQKPLVSGDRTIAQWTPLKRFVLNQDTGGAIKGPGRADLFWGSGAYAETAAGHLQHTGSLYFLILKEAAGSPAP